MEVKFDKNNYRVHSEENKNLIKKSLKDCGVGRSILVDADDCIIAGNGVYSQAKNMDFEKEVIETDGKELVVIVRTDLHTKDIKRKKLAVYDNSSSDMSEFDLDMLQADFDEDSLVDMGIELKRASNKEYHNSEIDLDDLTNDLDCVCPQCGMEFRRK